MKKLFFILLLVGFLGTSVAYAKNSSGMNNQSGPNKSELIDSQQAKPKAKPNVNPGVKPGVKPAG